MCSCMGRILASFNAYRHSFSSDHLELGTFYPSCGAISLYPSRSYFLSLLSANESKITKMCPCE